MSELDLLIERFEQRMSETLGGDFRYCANQIYWRGSVWPVQNPPTTTEAFLALEKRFLILVKVHEELGFRV